ncbi:hypothetical protein [Streptomyces sp. NPDC093600]|uniref:hypothetical protein n=1 Tax=Streptomyces sp. NPDC093600 TaxID=3366047 RepID=UPI0037FD40BE
MTDNAWTQWTRPATWGDAPDPQWWVPPLVATVAAPLLAAVVSGAENLFAPGSFMFAGSLLTSLALILPTWFLARTRRRRATRVGLAASGCALALAFPFLLATVGWIVLIVMLLTGNVRA